MRQTIVFVGPTLSAAQIHQALPDACIHRPVKVGDILRVLRLNPARLILIDGYYEQTPSVWHKEILYALSLGIDVIGASSMGALRAAELAHFGMRPIGAIARGYQDGSLTDDDEVAILHAGPEQQYQKHSEALVNMRATFSHAVQTGIITAHEEANLLDTAKAMFYPYRNYSPLFAQTPLSEEQQNAIRAQAIDQKALDAKEALDWAYQHPPSPATRSFDFRQTFYFYQLLYRMNSSPFDQPYPWLPEAERSVLQFQHTLGEDSWFLLQELAYLCQILYQIFLQTPEAFTGMTSGSKSHPPGKGIDGLLHWLSEQYQQLADTEPSLRQLNTIHQQLFYKTSKPASPQTQALLKAYTAGWLQLGQNLGHRFLRCHPKYQTMMLNTLWRQWHLPDDRQRQIWLSRHQIDVASVKKWAKLAYRNHILYQFFAGKGLVETPQLQAHNWLAELLFYFCPD
ncbi:MAG: hypothetical protein JJT82_03495 [Legionellaceae bacterium]|nr:hypothetical protein [Legionellaceae bacterium]